MYKAHVNETTEEVQSVKQHGENTAELCREFAIPELKDMMYAMGLLHDIGKYQDSFQRRMDGANIRVEHSACGAIEAGKNYRGAMALMMQYCIAGHHSGIPDGGYKNDTKDLPTLHGRMRRDFEDYFEYRKEFKLPQADEVQFVRFLVGDCGSNKEMLIDKFAFFTRYCFSCLTDADSLDTAAFCQGIRNRSLKSDFKKCLEKVNQKLDSFLCETELQRTRSVLQNQVFRKEKQDSEIYIMNMPTGSGKTLCSIKFALERAVLGNKKRIIYIIPYNSIIEQTSDSFATMFGKDAEILRHQSTFSYDDHEEYEEDYRKTAKNAAENWDSQFILTTAVQFFESIYANKRGKLRKLHNMSDSILVFDEAHLMPEKFMQPCLEAISYITKYLNSEAVFLSATMPDFRRLVKEYALPESKIVDLIDDTSMFYKFDKCRYHYWDSVNDEILLEKAGMYPSSLIVVNRRAAAKRLYEECGGVKYHLSTYMTAYDRRRVIQNIRDALLQLERDYPDGKDVPYERRITVISTSLIEAGVDLDFHTVFREMAGLDSILQAGGRCNREGKRDLADVFVFDFESERYRASMDEKGNITKGLISEYKNIASPECIRSYYDRLYFMRGDDYRQKAMYNYCRNIDSIPFRRYSDEFELINSMSVPVAAVCDENSRKLIETLSKTGVGDARRLQLYAFSVKRNEFDDLYRQHVIDDYGSGIWCLTNPDYYDRDTGVLFSGKDYYIDLRKEMV